MNKPLAPSFFLTDLQGRTHRLKQYAGKVIWLEFWVTWCAACQDTLPKKEVLFRAIQHPDLVFLTIDVTGREASPDRVTAFMEQFPFTFPVLRDEGTKIYDAYGITSVPTTVLINKQGEIHGMYDETVPLPEVIGEIGTLLSS
ncbi:TlpA family protein disulfide reductase [Laceyella putida]|uniref:TlpA family protein disulfide reductase n=1 Tax=Laceyella putida TaxID=110101 RepID=A0ABW2RPQ3_9BACL